jgi:hypothetical protein
MNTTVTEHTVELLRSVVTGDVVTSDNDGYDATRRAWNLAADQRPANVVAADSAADRVRRRLVGVPGSDALELRHLPDFWIWNWIQ